MRLRSFFGVAVVVATILLAALMAVARPKREVEVLKGLPWKAKVESEGYFEMSGMKGRQVYCSLENASLEGALAFYKTKFSMDRRWTQLPGGKTAFFFQFIDGAERRSMSVSASGGKTMLTYSEPFDKVGYFVSLMRSGGHARITSFGPRGVSRRI